MNYIGIDLGTSSVKGLLLDETQTIIATHSLDYPLYVTNDGESEQDPSDWLKQSLAVIKQLLAVSANQVAAISFSGQMHGLVTVDNQGQVIRNAILWNDQRTVEQCKYLNETIGSDVLIKNTANIALTGFTAPKILWMREHEPENFAKIAKIMLPKDYLVYKLTDICATDVSDASGTLYFDVKNREWSQPMLDILNITTEMLPTVYESSQKVGQLTNEMKSALEIDYNIDIVIGGGDQAIGAIGVGAVDEQTMLISLGTSGVVYVPSSKFQPNENASAHSFCDATGKYHTMGVTLNAAGSVNWWYSQILQKANFNEIEHELLEASEDNELFFLPYLNGERSPINDANVRGCFLGLSLSHTQFDMTRAVIEGITFSLKHVFDSMELANIDQINITGGGAKNKVWVQLISEIFQLPVHTITVNEGPALGAALLALSSHQQLDISEVSKKSLQLKDVFEPKTDGSKYQAKYKSWLEVYGKIK